MEQELDSNLLENTKIQVDKEIKEYSHGGYDLSGYLNNFTGWLMPEGHGTTMSNYRDRYLEDDLRDVKMLDFMVKNGEDEDYIKEHSGFMLNKTGSEILEDIDRSLKANNISREEMAELQQKRNQESTLASVDRMRKAQLPVFIYLRAMGYGHKDLTS